MAAELGHHASRPYIDQAGNVHTNGASIFNAAERDITSFIENTGLSSVASADGAITQKSGTVFVTKAGVAVLTIADPTATTDDNKELVVMSVTANAHTLSNAAGSGFNAGGAGTDVGTYGGAKGDNIVLRAYQGVWYVKSKINVTLG